MEDSLSASASLHDECDPLLLSWLLSDPEELFLDFFPKLDGVLPFPLDLSLFFFFSYPGLR